jgi:endonuclease YncB( thermonuclease family)
VFGLDRTFDLRAPARADKTCPRKRLMRRTITTALIAAFLLVGLAGCGLTEPPGTATAAESTPKVVATPDTTAKASPASKVESTAKAKPAAKPRATPKPKPGVTATVYRWIDGDTVDTSRGTIRLIGLDTPEQGRCGAATATKAARRWAPVGSTVRLVNPSSVIDTDRYGRSLRYVVRGRIDISKAQIVKGAQARYDSTDGYQWHPRQASYHQADREHRDYRCSSKKRQSSSHPSSTTPTSKWNCPSWAPIKGNDSSMIYHMPWNRYYDATTPERCFSTETAAEAAGYRAAKV